MKKKTISVIMGLNLMISSVLSVPVLADSGILSGDVNADGVITSLDYAVIQRYFSGQKTDSISLVNSDVNNDGAVNIADIILLKQLILPDIPDPYMNSDKVKIANQLSQIRTEQGFSDLKLDAALSYVADIRAQEIVSNFDTTRADGTKVDSLLKSYGLSTYSYHEYICRGMYMEVSDIVSDIKQKDRIIKGNFNRVGVGYTYSAGKKHWVLIFNKQ